MLWFNKKNINDKTEYEFYQVFEYKNIVFQKDLNIIYSLNLLDYDDNFDFNKFESKKIKMYIKIIDQIISYTDSETDNTLVFTFENNFIEPDKNQYSLPIFHSKYKLINKNMMPNLINLNYDFTYELEFEIFNIDDNIQFIIENNPNTNIKKKYWIVTNLNLLLNFIKKK